MNNLKAPKIAIFTTVLIMLASIPGCIFDPVEFDKCEDEDNCLTIAFETKEEYRNSDENPQLLADRLEELMDMEVEIYTVSGPAATIAALEYGKADIGFLDGGAAWLSMSTRGFEVAAAEQKADGRPYYNAVAWVHKDSDMAQADMDDDPATDPYTMMAGKISCHTSPLGSSGMLLPMGFLINNGYVEIVGDPNTMDSLYTTVRAHFSEDSSIPDSGTLYRGYSGSLRCLAEHELGSATDYISFAKDPTVPDYCGDDPESWCFKGDFTSTEDFYPLGGYNEDGETVGFGRAPSHPIMYNPEFFFESDVAALRTALDTMNNNAEDLEILDDVLGTPGITITNSSVHMGTYGDSIEEVPGIAAYLNDKVNKTSSEESSNLVLYGGLAVAGLAIVTGAIFIRNRNQNQNLEPEESSTE